MASEFTCQIGIPDVVGLETDVLTVGRVFDLECTGPWPDGVQANKIQVFNEKTDKPDNREYILKILDGRAVSKDVIQFKTTTYIVGKTELPQLVLTDGERKFEAGALKFEVKSVLDPMQPKQEPYGPVGTMTIPIPLSWWVGLLIVLLGLLGLLFSRLRRRNRRRELLKKLREHDSALSPAAEFYNRMRKIRREYGIFAGAKEASGEASSVVTELERIFRVYFMRQFEVPALDVGDAVLMRAFRRENKRAFREVGADVQKLFKEFAAAKTSTKVEAKDAVQLSDETRSLVETIEKLQTHSKERG